MYAIRSYYDIIWKYVGWAGDGQAVRPGSYQNSANWIIYRLSDVLLMKAEALSQIGRYSEALAIVNNIRKERNMNSKSCSESAQDFEDLIMQERALELAFEGKRWFDLMRIV